MIYDIGFTCRAIEGQLEWSAWFTKKAAMTLKLMSAFGVRRDKAALSPWVKIPLGYRSSRKQPEQLWR